MNLSRDDIWPAAFRTQAQMEGWLSRNVTRLTVEGEEAGENTSAPLKEKLTLGVFYKASEQKHIFEGYLRNSTRLLQAVPYLQETPHTTEAPPAPPEKSSPSAVM